MRIDKNGNPEYIAPATKALIKECHWVVKMAYYTGAMKFINVLQYATCQEVILKWRLWHPITWLYVVFAFTLSMIGHAITVISTYKYEILKDVTCTIDHTNTRFKRNPLFKKEEV